MTPRALAALLAAAATILGTACSDGSTSPSGSQLSRAEIVALARALQGQPLRLSAAKTPNHPDVSASVGLETIDVRIDTVLQCAGGQGSLVVAAHVQGSSDEQGKNATLQVEATMTHRGCAVEISPAKTVEVTSTPSLVSQLSFVLTNGQLADPVTGTTRGSFTWRTTTGAGRCTVEITGSISPSTTRGNVRGTLCGVTIDETT